MTPARAPLIAWVLAVVAVITAVTFAFAFSGTSLWLDEAYSVLLAHRSPGEVVDLLRTDNGPPLYYWVLSGWVALFGDGERTIRALSGLAYLGTGGVLFFAGRRVHRSVTAGVLAATLFWISPLAVRHAFSARMYAGLGLFTAGAIALFLRELDGSATRGSRWVAAALNLAGLLLQYWFGFVLLAQVAALWAVARPRRLGALLPLVLPVGVFAVLWGPILRAQLGSGTSSWIEPVGVGALVTTFLDFYGSWIAIVAFLAFGAAVLVRTRPSLAVADGAELSSRAGGRTGGALLVLCVLSVAVPWVVSLWKPLYVVGRYTLVALPPFVLFIGGALDRSIGAARAVWLVMPLLVLRILATTGDQRSWARRDQAQSSRASSRVIVERATPDAQVVYTGLGGVTLGYYLERSGRQWSQRTFPAELQAHPGWMRTERLMAHAEALRSEARALASALGSSEVWHVHEEGDPVAELLEDALHERRGAPSRHDALPGSFHDTASVYPALRAPPAP